MPPSSRGYLTCPHPVGPTCLPQNLTPASGRQDHTILPSAAIVSRQHAVDRSQVPKNSPCDPIARQTLPRPPHPVPYVRDDRETPLCVGRDGETHRDVSTRHGSEKFFEMGLDNSPNHWAEPFQQIARSVRLRLNPPRGGIVAPDLRRTKRSLSSGAHSRDPLASPRES